MSRLETDFEAGYFIVGEIVKGEFHQR